jgi:hypothetical protein
MNKSGTKIVTAKVILEEDPYCSPSASPTGKLSHKNLKSISYEFKFLDILDDNYCCKIREISMFILKIPNQEVEADRYNNQNSRCFSLIFSQNEEIMMYFDGIKS